MKSRHFILMFLSVLWLGVSAAQAQTSAFTYQGLLSQNGVAANGFYDFRFQLFDAVSAGNSLGSLQFTNHVSVTNGLFTVAIDFGVAPDTEAGRWLQVTVSTNGGGSFTTLTPRQRLTPAPYANFAQIAGTVTNGGIASAQLAPGAIASSNIASGQVLKSLNGLTDSVSLSEGPNITINVVGNSLQISAPSWTNNPIAQSNLDLTGTLSVGGTSTFTNTATFLSDVKVQYATLAAPTSSRTIFGNQAGFVERTNVTVDSEDTLFGHQAGYSLLGTYNSYNSVFGSAALGNATNGAGNSAFGQKAFNQAINAQSSVAIGSKAGSSVLNPNADTFVGYAANQFGLGGGPSGGNRVAIGWSSASYDDGGYNTYIGALSGPNSGTHGTADNNVGIGYDALSSITSGTQMTSVGAHSAQHLQMGGSSVVVGYQAGQHSTFMNSDVFIGPQAGFDWTTSTGSILLGYLAGYGNQQNNVMVVGYDNSTGYIGDVYIGGNSFSATASFWPVTFHGTSGKGFDVPGASVTYAAGSSTGAGNGGNVNLAVSLPGALGNATNALFNALTISGANGSVNINGLLAAPTNTASFDYITNPIVSGVFWTNTTAARVTLHINYTLVDSVLSGSPGLCMTNVATGDWFNATNSFALDGTSSGRATFNMSPNDWIICTNKSSGSASAMVDGSFAVKQ